MFIRTSKQSVTNPSNTKTFVFTEAWLHVSVCIDHHQATITKLSKQGKTECDYIHIMGSHISYYTHIYIFYAVLCNNFHIVITTTRHI
jgi:hypothetical protein